MRLYYILEHKVTYHCAFFTGTLQLATPSIKMYVHNLSDVLMSACTKQSHAMFVHTHHMYAIIMCIHTCVGAYCRWHNIMHLFYSSD